LFLRQIACQSKSVPVFLTGTLFSLLRFQDWRHITAHVMPE
jgi:hypothetical protein